jgi:hypothetical protein
MITLGKKRQNFKLTHNHKPMGYRTRGECPKRHLFIRHPPKIKSRGNKVAQGRSTPKGKKVKGRDQINTVAVYHNNKITHTKETSIPAKPFSQRTRGQRSSRPGNTDDALKTQNTTNSSPKNSSPQFQQP